MLLFIKTAVIVASAPAKYLNTLTGIHLLLFIVHATPDNEAGIGHQGIAQRTSPLDGREPYRTGRKRQ
jgi:hypothetical protein